MSDFDRIEETREQNAGLHYEDWRDRMRGGDTYYVTVIVAAGREITVEVEATSKEGARRAARELHPDGHIIHVEEA